MLTRPLRGASALVVMLTGACATATMQLQGAPPPEALSALADSSSVVSGVWLTPRGSLVRLHVRDSLAVGTYIQRAPSDTSILGDTVIKGVVRAKRLIGTYYALYTADNARNIIKCAARSDGKISPDTLLRSQVVLRLIHESGPGHDDNALDGTSRYVAGIFGADCDDLDHVRPANDALVLRRVRDLNTPWTTTSFTGAQTDEGLRGQLGGRGFMKGILRAAAIASAIDAAKKGDTAMVTQSLTTAVYTDSVLDAAAGITPSSTTKSSSNMETSAATAGSEASNGATGGPYTGPYAAEVRILLSSRYVIGGKYPSCATCDDFKFPTVQINQNSERDTYVAAAVLQAFAAESHARVGKPKLAAEEATGMHKNLEEANKLCTPGRAVAFQGGGSGPQTLKIWSCPPPLTF